MKKVYLSEVLKMNAEIIAVGNEVVMGHTINTNASYLAKALQDIGIMTQYHTAICDEPETIKAVLDCALKRAKVIIITGGLGPTKDDLTKSSSRKNIQQSNPLTLFLKEVLLL